MISMLFPALFGFVVVSALQPAVLFLINLRRFRPPPRARQEPVPVSVLIPARNEEANIGAALDSVLASHAVGLEVLVWDDGSQDRTAEIVSLVAAHDSRVHLLGGEPLPPGWNGKQHACWRLAHAAAHPTLVFLDADVRVEPDLFSNMAAFQRASGAALVSGFPRLVTVGFLEKLLLPLIHFVLLAYLPMRAMRRRRWPSAAAGCGQFLMVNRSAYFACGGHSMIRETMHDGLLLPRAFRKARLKTDIADITALAHVRMYTSAAAVWNGLAKNATEGIATPGKVVPLSLLLFAGQIVAPLFGVAALLDILWHLGAGSLSFALPFVAERHIPLRWLLLFAALVMAGWLPRLLAARRFRQPQGSALLHPVGIAVLLVLQWYALLRKLLGRPVGWRQRNYSSGTGAEVTS